MEKFKSFQYPIILIASGLLLFFPYLGTAHLFDWDEINFAESAREMLITKDYFRVTIDFVPFTEKPPLFFWLQALSMKVFGVNEFAARFPNAFMGLIILMVLYTIGKKVESPLFGFIWASGFLGSLLPHLYFRSGIIDPVFNFFMFVGIYYLFKAVSSYNQPGSSKHSILAGVFTGLSVLTKGPVGLLIVGLSFMVYWSYVRFKPLVSVKNVLFFFLSFLLVSSAWYGVETYKNGTEFIKEFIIRQLEIFTTSDAGHGQPFYYHFVVLLLGCFPISILSMKAFFTNRVNLNEPSNIFRIWMIAVFCVVLTIFSISTTKIIHYSSMAYYPLTFLAAYYVYQLLNKKASWNKWIGFAGITLTFVLAILITGIGILPFYMDKLIPHIHDPFVLGNLSANVHWSGYEWMIGILFLAGTITGWIKVIKSQYREGFVFLYATVAITLFLFTSAVVPKIEQYTQGANIRFFKSLKNQDVYAGTLGYKSYAHLFYTNKQAHQLQVKDFEYLANNPIGVPVYLSVKITHRHRIEAFPEFQLLKEENGFLFYVKKPSLPPGQIQ